MAIVIIIAPLAFHVNFLITLFPYFPLYSQKYLWYCRGRSRLQSLLYWWSHSVHSNPSIISPSYGCVLSGHWR